jgi:hypothetical protein
MGSFGDHRDVVMSKIDFPRPLPIVEKQHETARLNVVSLALPVTAFRSCQEEDALIVDAAEVFAGRLYRVTKGGCWTERLDCLPTLGPGLLAVSGYSHVLDALWHPEQRGRLLSLFES